MEFSSLPLYQDSPNWPLQQDLQRVNPRDAGSDQLPPPTAPAPAPAPAPARPGSMAERARLAKLPQQAEPSQLKCPRCESTNTKFCYFNNYNLTQPRHLCKTCRRYWTHGGALRSIPVGGGCRRNKRTKTKTPSKSPMITSTSLSTSATVVSSAPVHQGQMPFFHPRLQNLPDFGNGNSIGLGFGQIHDFQNGVNVSTMPLNLSARFADLWRGQPPQFPFLAAEQFQSGAVDQFGPRMLTSEAAAADSVKQEGKNFLSINPGNEDQYWGSGNVNAWTPDLPAAGSTSSTTFLL